MKRIIGVVVLALIISNHANAQHEHHNMTDTTKKAMKMADTMKMNMPGMTMKTPMHHSMSISHVYSRNLPMNRNGSGTGWLPDASPMYGYMFHTPRWMYMLHGNFFLRYNNQDFTNKGTRGGSKIDAPDWLMFMGQRQVGEKGLFHFSVMSSFDAPLGGSNGYPLLFQSGEAYKGSSIVYRQHPHDMFSELSVSYDRRSRKKQMYLCTLLTRENLPWDQLPSCTGHRQWPIRMHLFLTTG
jgi:hypothetical protein